VDDFSKRTQILLFMQTEESTLRLRRTWSGGTNTALTPGHTAPTPFIPEAHALANRFATKINGRAFALATETVLGIPSTAHILGGACMAESPEKGVIDHQHRLFGYPNIWVVDGSAISANPGVNPSLTITALAERAMTFIEPKN
jgi:cholesterol oxidase